MITIVKVRMVAVDRNRITVAPGVDDRRDVTGTATTKERMKDTAANAVTEASRVDAAPNRRDAAASMGAAVDTAEAVNPARETNGAEGVSLVA